MSEVKLKNNGWALKFDGSREGAVAIVSRIWGEKYKPTMASSYFAHHADQTTFLVQSMETRTVFKGQWLAYRDGIFTVEEFIPDDWKAPPEDGMSPLARAIWADWMANSPYLGRR